MTVDLVVKVGGSLFADGSQLDATLEAIAAAASRRRLVIVPGGGAFADAVRDVDRRIGLSDDAAHWMAILAMDQHAQLIVDRLPAGVVVQDPPEIGAAFTAGRIPVLALFRWLRAADPLPHSWDVTSDSIAAWVAGVVGAAHLVLVKPPGAMGDALVDAYFPRALPPTVTTAIVAADQRAALETALDAGMPTPR